MKLKDSFITQDMDDIQFLVPIGREAFQGLVRSNSTAAFIVNQLKEETSETKIAEAVEREYDAPGDVIAADVKKVLDTLRRIGALEE